MELLTGVRVGEEGHGPMLPHGEPHADASEDTVSPRPGGSSRAALVRVGAGLLCVAGVVAGAPLTPASALPNPPAAGLPQFHAGKATLGFDPPLVTTSGDPFPRQTQIGSVDSAFASGQTDAKRAKIAIRLPTALTAINLVSEVTQKPVLNRKGRVVTGKADLFTERAFVYVTSPHGSSPEFGLLPPTTITTLAFGILPVTVTLQLSQPRQGVTPQTPQGTPVPLVAFIYQDQGRNINYDTTVDGPIDLTISRLVVDGRRVDVGSSCRTTSPATLSLVGKYSSIFPTPAGFYNPTFGGDVYGVLKVPAFTGCRGGTGDDLSALFTNALSGDTTSVHLSQAGLGQQVVDCSLRETSSAGATPCVQVKTLPAPTGAGQVPSAPPDWTPAPPPPPLPILPDPEPTSPALP